MLGVDLFAGAGGMSLGAKMAGIHTKIAIESDQCAFNTYKLNLGSETTRYHAADIRKFKKIDLRNSAEPVVVYGGPPCQGFSTSNQKTRSADNSENWLFEEFLRVVGLYSPEWVVFENVKGILETSGGVFIDYILDSFAVMGYTTSISTLNAGDYGVPQRRDRLFIVASKRGVSFDFPHPINKKYSVQCAIGDLPSLTNGAKVCRLPYDKKADSEYAKSMRGELEACNNNLVTKNADYVVERYRHVSPGGNWEQIPFELMQNYADPTRCHTGIYRRLENDKQSVVIGNFRKNMLIHPIEDRGLSVREAARLQSFPDWFTFTGSIGFQQQQVGNAVPPLLAKAVFSTILAYENDQ